jgi:hypothetical protein
LLKLYDSRHLPGTGTLLINSPLSPTSTHNVPHSLCICQEEKYFENENFLSITPQSKKVAFITIKERFLRRYFTVGVRWERVVVPWEGELLYMWIDILRVMTATVGSFRI